MTQVDIAEAAEPKESARSQTVASVERAADILLHFAGSDTPDLGITDIASELGLSKAAVHRLLASLKSRGLVKIDEQSHRYSLGPMSMVLGLRGLQRSGVLQVASEELPAVVRATNETATLSLRSGDNRVYVEQWTPDRPIIMSIALGVTYPLHLGASSKVILANLPDDEIDSYLSRAQARTTVRGGIDIPAVRDELAVIRAQGWAQTSEERQSGAASVAAPILDHMGRPVAVASVGGPAERFQAELDLCRTELLAATERISNRLGLPPLRAARQRG
jgi:IclR family acetate operon transcriptional repressor